MFLLDYFAKIEELKHSNAHPDLIIKLYQDAVQVWTSVQLWCDYLEYIQYRLPVGKVVEELERCVDKVGIGFDSTLVWRFFIQYCLANSMKAKADEVEERMRRAVLKDSEVVDKAMHDEYQYLMSFEEHLSDPKCHAEYAAAERQRSHPNHVRIVYIYERAITLFPEDIGLWTSYIDYVKSCAHNCASASSVYQKALQTFPSNTTLHSDYMHFMEKSGASMEDINSAFKGGLSAANNKDPAIGLCITYLGIIKRTNPAWAVERCKDILDHFNDLRLHRFYLSLLVSMNMVNEALSHWKLVIIKQNPHVCSLWLEYIAFTRQVGTSDVRNLYAKACSGVTDEPEKLFESWTDFENVYGDADSLESAKSRIEIRRGFFARSATSRNKRYFDDSLEPTTSVKPQEKAKVPKTAAERNMTLYLSNLDYKLSQGKLRAFLQAAFGNIVAVRMPRAKENGVSSSAGHVNRGFAYVEFSDESSYDRALRSDKIRIDGRPMYITMLHEKHENKVDSERDPKTLFVSHLHHDTTKAEIESVFSSFKGLKEVRQVIAKSGRSRGCAYVEFDSADSASAALVENGRDIRGIKISVAISDPQAKSSNIQEKRSEALIPPSLLRKRPC